MLIFFDVPRFLQDANSMQYQFERATVSNKLNTMLRKLCCEHTIKLGVFCDGVCGLDVRLEFFAMENCFPMTQFGGKADCIADFIEIAFVFQHGHTGTAENMRRGENLHQNCLDNSDGDLCSVFVSSNASCF